jgi:hypothetical protein
MCALRPRASAQTAAALTIGTATPITSAISATPGSPERRAATARPM